jgi:hypothetical protein
MYFICRMDPFPPELLLPLWFDNEPLQIGLEPEPVGELDFMIGDWIGVGHGLLPFPIVDEGVPLPIEEEIIPHSTPPPMEAERFSKKRKYDKIWKKWDANRRTKARQ